MSETEISKLKKQIKRLKEQIKEEEKKVKAFSKPNANPMQKAGLVGATQELDANRRKLKILEDQLARITANQPRGDGLSNLTNSEYELPQGKQKKRSGNPLKPDAKRQNVKGRRERGNEGWGEWANEDGGASRRSGRSERSGKGRREGWGGWPNEDDGGANERSSSRGRRREGWGGWANEDEGGANERSERSGMSEFSRNAYRTAQPPLHKGESGGAPDNLPPLGPPFVPPASKGFGASAPINVKNGLRGQARKLPVKPNVARLGPMPIFGPTPQARAPIIHPVAPLPVIPTAPTTAEPAASGFLSTLGLGGIFSRKQNAGNKKKCYC